MFVKRTALLFHEVTLGWRGEILERALLEIDLTETVVTYDNSPDFAVHIGLAYTSFRKSEVRTCSTFPLERVQLGHLPFLQE